LTAANDPGAHLKEKSRPTVIVGLFIQQAIAMFVLKSDAGYDIFRWIATLAADFLGQSEAGAAFFFDEETVGKHWFFVNTVRFVPTSGPTFFSNASIARSHHLLRCIRANDVLPRRDAVAD
jgi:hypothetical protein